MAQASALTCPSRFSRPSSRRATSSLWTTSAAIKGRAITAPRSAPPAKLFFLPAYSPDLNPIEQAFTPKMKTLLRKADARTIRTDLANHRAPCSTASRRQNALTTSETQDMLQPKQIAL